MSELRTVDALFVSTWLDVDAWHNDGLAEPANRSDASVEDWTPPEDDLSREARMTRQAVAVDGRRLDMPRMLSWVARGDTTAWRRYDPYVLSSLAGTYYSSWLLRHGYTVEHVNLGDRQTIGRVAERLRPRFALLSTSLISSPTTLMSAVRTLREAFPDAVVVLGGQTLIEVWKSLDPVRFERLLIGLGADAYVVTIGGQEALLHLLAHGVDPAAPPPNTWVRDGRRVVAGPRDDDRGTPLDEGAVRWELVDPASLYHTVHLRTARSCAFSCAFCSYWTNQGPLTTKEIATVRGELEAISRHHPHVRSLVFTDDTFNVPTKRFRQILEVLSDFRFEWYSFFRPQHCDEELAERMVRSGCKMVFMGLESVDDRVLVNMNKRATQAKYRRGIHALKSAGITTHANFIVGYPGDREENARITLDFVDETGVDSFAVSPWYLSPATPVSDRREEFGIEGNFWVWKHATMDARTAHRLSREMMDHDNGHAFTYEDVSNGFWSNILLRTNGFEPAEIRWIFHAYHVLSKSGRTAAELRADPMYARLKALIDRVPMAPGSDERF